MNLVSHLTQGWPNTYAYQATPQCRGKPRNKTSMQAALLCRAAVAVRVDADIAAVPRAEAGARKLAIVSATKLRMVAGWAAVYFRSENSASRLAARME